MQVSMAGGKAAPADEERRYIEQVRLASYPVLAGQAIPLSAAKPGTITDGTSASMKTFCL